MAVEKYYGRGNTFFAWHCLVCGEIIDPVILLHRLSKNASIAIPENEKEMMSLIWKYLPRPKNIMKGKTP